MYNSKASEILKCTKGVKKVFLRHLERWLLFLPFCLPHFAKPTHPHAFIPELYTDDPQKSTSQPRCTCRTQTFTSKFWLGISMFRSKTYHTHYVQKLCFPSLKPCPVFLLGKYPKPSACVLSFESWTRLLSHPYLWTTSDFSLLHVLS